MGIFKIQTDFSVPDKLEVKVFILASFFSLSWVGLCCRPDKIARSNQAGEALIFSQEVE